MIIRKAPEANRSFSLAEENLVDAVKIQVLSRIGSANPNPIVIQARHEHIFLWS
jgi:hypothetical protein